MDTRIIAAAPPPAFTRLAWLLAGAGTLPFLGGIVDLASGGGAALAVVPIYAAVIASFIAGIHWAAALLEPHRFGIRLLIASNGAALLGWLGALLPPTPGFLLFAVLFPALAGVDRQLWRVGLWPLWFWRLRAAISAVVTLACLALAALAAGRPA